MTAAPGQRKYGGIIKMDYMEMSRKKRVAEAKSDLIGAIHNSEVYELLDFHRATTAGEKESWVYSFC